MKKENKMSYNNSPLNTKNRINFVTNEKPVLEFIDKNRVWGM